MDLNRVDIFEIYQRFRDIRSGKAYDDENHSQNDEMQTGKFLRDALAQLLKYVESRVHNRASVFGELQKLMSKLGAMVDSSEFSCFYEFVFFMCRENGQKNITVSKAIAVWRLVLAGRFRLLNQWCEFIQENQRHNISEDTWQQVLAFSRCVHENLEGYDPEGAWPVLVDDFVEHMYRVLGSREDANFFCDGGDSESHSCILDETLPGLKVASGLKRKLPNCEDDEMESSDILVSDCPNPNPTRRLKRNKLITHTQRSSNWEDNEAGYSCSDCMEINQADLSIGIFKSPCAIEGYLSRGFAGLFSSHSLLQFDRERSASYT